MIELRQKDLFYIRSLWFGELSMECPDDQTLEDYYLQHYYPGESIGEKLRAAIIAWLREYGYEISEDNIAQVKADFEQFISE